MHPTWKGHWHQKRFCLVGKPTLLGTLNTWTRSSHWITERREIHISQTEFIAHQLTGWELKRVSMILELKLTRLTSVIDICGQTKQNTEFYGESWMGKEWLEMPALVLPWKFCCFLSFSFKSIKPKRQWVFATFLTFLSPMHSDKMHLFSPEFKSFII